jgi:hypothetical protein
MPSVKLRLLLMALLLLGLGCDRTPLQRRSGGGPRESAAQTSLLWITGGDCNSIGDVWSPAPPENDQTASAFRQAGIVMMYPSLRGGNGYSNDLDWLSVSQVVFGLTMERAVRPAL